jgi:hypothetical protein
MKWTLIVAAVLLLVAFGPYGLWNNWIWPFDSRKSQVADMAIMWKEYRQSRDVVEREAERVLDEKGFAQFMERVGK